MGIFRYPLQVQSADAGRWETIEALVDTGAAYTWLPESNLRSLGFEPTIVRLFELADGAVVERGMAQVPVQLDGDQLVTLCIFGDEGTEPLLGMVTLEEFGLSVDTVGQRLFRRPLPLK